MKSLLLTMIGASLLRCLAITIIALPAFCIHEIHADTYAGGDYDGDRRADPVQVTDDNWFIWLSSGQYQLQGLYDFSIEGGTFLSADFDGDIVADVAMVDSSCNWYIGFSSGSYQIQGPYNLLCESGIPLAADMDGDGKADPVWWSAATGTSGFLPVDIKSGGPMIFLFPAVSRWQVIWTGTARRTRPWSAPVTGMCGVHPPIIRRLDLWRWEFPDLLF